MSAFARRTIEISEVGNTLRIVVAAYADKAYFFGMVPTAWALRAAGHEVRIATQPSMTDAAAETGLTVVPVGGDHSLAEVVAFGREQQGASIFDLSEERPEMLVPEKLRDAYEEYVTWWWKLVNEPMAEDLVAFCREWKPDLVLWEPNTYSGAIAAEACGAAHGRFLWSVDLFSRLRRLYLSGDPDPAVPDPLTAWLTETAREFGVDFSEDLVLGQFSLHQLPESLRLRELESGTHLSVRPVPYGGSAVLPAWAREEVVKRRVLVDWGSWSRTAEGAAALVDVVDAAMELGAEPVVLSPRSREDALPALPAEVRVADSGAAHLLMGSGSLLVHGGGFDVCCNALVEGLPQLVVLNADQFDAGPLCRSLQDRGSLLAVSLGEALSKGVDHLMAELLDSPGARAAAGRMRDEVLAVPAPDRVVPLLERIAADRGAVGG
ncbi:DUF1205 domain-containing protein [Nocardiopsis tropica]